MRPIGDITRGTTNPNRLRRFDRWIQHTYPHLLELVVDLGYGAYPVTTVEMHHRLRPPRTVGLEIDPERVTAAQPFTEPGLEFRRGGFELAGLQPTLVRACNVLRQYSEEAAAEAWATITGHLAESGVLVEGTCDELGRVCAWLAGGADGPESLTFSVSLRHLERPSVIAERLPKALIHHNVSGEHVHALLSTLDCAWLSAAPYGVFGQRERWIQAVRAVREAGWPVQDGTKRWRLGEMTVAWE